jgi:release factor glutamine methyltransferase
MPSPMMPISSGTSLTTLLRHTSLDQLETRILISHALGLTRVQLITQSDRILNEQEARQLTDLFQRRLNGEPIAYITGEREFYGLSFHVTPDVLIPRPETELLVELALERLPQHGRLLDMGTGSGAIPISIAHLRADASVTALDESDAALSIAQRNAEQHSVAISFLQSDWYAALNVHARFDVITANPPYIAAGDPHLLQGDLRFEPVGALTDHHDGLSALRAVIAGAPNHLTNNGWLLMEHGYDQAAQVRELLDQRGFCAVQSWTDLAGIERVSGGKIPM